MDTTKIEKFCSAFPLVGGPVPLPHEESAAFLDAVNCQPPSWFYHLAVSRRNGDSECRFAPCSGRQLRILIRKLRLDLVAGTAPAYLLEAQEFPFGMFPTPEYSPYTFALPPSQIEGKSYGLTVALLLMAAATRRPLPPWISASGCIGNLKSDQLELDPAGGQSVKIAMANGCDPQFNSRPLLVQLYSHAGTERWLGPRTNRTTTGDVKLLIFSGNDGTCRLSNEQFAAERVEDSDAHRVFDAADFDELKCRIDEIAGDDLLVAHVPTVFDALWLLGYHKCHPYVEQRISVCVGSRFSLHRIVALDRKEVFRLHVDAARKSVQAHQDFRNNNRVQALLEVACQLLQCNAGDVAVVADERAPALLRVDASIGEGAKNLPRYIPGDAGINHQVLSQNDPSPVIVEDMTRNPRYQELISDHSPARGRFTSELWNNYLNFLRSVRACVKFPLIPDGQNRAIGVFCLHRTSAGPFDPSRLRIIAELVRDAASIVQEQLEVDRQAKEMSDKIHEASKNLQRWNVRVPNRVGESQVLIQNGAGSPHSSSSIVIWRDKGEAQLAGSLAKEALELGGGYRTVVRLVSLTGTELWVGGLASKAEGDWPSDYAQRVFPLEADAQNRCTAAAAAIRTRRTIYIADTGLADCEGYEYEPIPPNARAVAAIPLKDGSTILGALSVDWRDSPHPDLAVLPALEHLAAHYAAAIRKWRKDTLFAEVESQLAENLRCDTAPDLKRLLRLVAWTLGAQRGSIYLRRRETGHYHLATNLLHPEWTADNSGAYESGFGLTGWVAKYNRPLRLADVTNGESDEFKSFGADRPHWQNFSWDGKSKHDVNPNFLGVPISSGDDVFGVLRMSSRSEDIGFDSDDQAMAQVVGSRLGAWYQRCELAGKRDILQTLRKQLRNWRTVDELFRGVLSALQSGIGSCESELRLAHDNTELRRMAMSGSGWRSDAASLPLNDGFSGRAFGARTTQFYVDGSDAELATVLSQRRSLAAGCGVVLPLLVSDNCVRGTLHVHRLNRRSLLPCDVTFAEEVATYMSLILERVL